MYSIILLVVGIVAVAYGNDCVKKITNNSPIENCCDLGFRHSTFGEVVNTPNVYHVKNFCGNCHSSPTSVYCDTVTAGGGWTVIQRRQQGGGIEFRKRDWVEYEDGFGNLTGEFWLGLRSMSCLTSNGNWELRIDYQYRNGTKSYLHYKQFAVGPAEDQYQLTISGFQFNKLIRFEPFFTHINERVFSLNGMRFSSRDRDLDGFQRGNCGKVWGGWWHNACSQIILNHADGQVRMLLNNDVHFLTFVEMKIRPLDCLIV